MHNKCSQADTAYNYVNRSKAEQRTRTNLAHSNKLTAEGNHPIYNVELVSEYLPNSFSHANSLNTPCQKQT